MELLLGVVVLLIVFALIALVFGIGVFAQAMKAICYAFAWEWFAHQTVAVNEMPHFWLVFWIAFVITTIDLTIGVFSKK